MKHKLPYAMTLVSATLVLGMGCGKPSPQMPPHHKPTAKVDFVDVTKDSRIDFVCRNGVEAKAFSIAETLGGGAGVIDYNQDGKMDLFLVGGGTIELDVALHGLPGGLFRNLDGLQFDNVSEQANMHQSQHYAHAVAISDYNSDGFDDILVTGYGGLTLYRNQGDGTFVKVTTEAGLDDDRWSSAAGWGDVNGDGLVDLFVVHYLDWSWQNNPACFPNGEMRDACGPREFSGLSDSLYLATGDGTFVDVSEDFGIKPGGKGLGVVMMDFDGDGDLDIYVANDTDDNYLYLNDALSGLTEQGVIAGAAQDQSGFANGSMGVSVFDYNGDSLPDLWVTNYENDSFALYRNEGGAAFTHASGSAGIFAVGSSYVAWGTITDDIDNDGDDDIVVSNGHVQYFPKNGETRQLPLVLLYQEGQFEALTFTPDCYLGQRHHGRGLVKCDIDNDGDWDLGFANLNEPFALLRNDTESQRLWFGIRLIGVLSNRNAVGTNVTLKTDEGDRTQFVTGGGSYLSQSDRRLLWTVPPGTQSAVLEIQWPGGREQQVVVREFNQYLDIVEQTQQ